MKTIYIVLTRTGTMLARVINFYERTEYNHVSIALDYNFKTMYSFGRINPNNPVIGGFVEEEIGKGVFAKFSDTTTQIYEMMVTDEQYQKIKENIDMFKENKNKYKYNIAGLLFAAINRNYNQVNKFYCSQFVRHILKKSEVDVSALKGAAKPEDFKRINMNLVYEGLLNNYNCYEKAI